MALKSTVCEANKIVTNWLTAGAKTEMMIRGPEDRRSAILAPKVLYCLARESFSLTDALDVSLATVLNHLGNSLGTKIFHLPWTQTN
jgi:hypothetical protein